MHMSALIRIGRFQGHVWTGYMTEPTDTARVKPPPNNDTKHIDVIFGAKHRQTLRR